MLLLGGALLLVSLYLPWQRASLDLSDYDGTRETLLLLFGGMDSWDGWYSEVAPAAALATLVLIGLVAAVLVRPGLEERLPIGRSAMIAAYFGLAVAFDVRSRAQLDGGNIDLGNYHLDYGAYLGIASAVVLLAGAGSLRRQEVLESRSLPAGIATVFVSGLLVAFLLPWYGFVEISRPGISVPAAQLAAAVALVIPGSAAWWRLGQRASVDRFGLALFAALFTGGAVASVTFLYEREYGAWVGLAFAIVLVGLSLLDGLSVPDVPRMPWSRLVLGAVAVLFVTTLFLPATEYCYPAGDIGPSAACFPQKAWLTLAGSAAGALAMALIVHALLPERRWFSPLELTAGIGLLVTTFGFQFSEGDLVLMYGFWIAAACAAVLVAVAFARARIELDARLVPLAVCLVYLAVVVPPWWSVVDLPERVRWAFWFAPFSWLTIAGALLCLTLMRLWLERREAALWVVLVPAAMATLVVVDLARAEAMTWGGGIVLGLCALLALFAWGENARGLGRLHVPEALRIDRL